MNRLAVRITLSVTAFVGSVAQLAAQEPSRPDIVMFVSDDHGALDCSIGGNAQDFPTPNLARLAARGMTFTRAFAASPSCAPSRAALLTGLMPTRNGAMLNHQPPRADLKKFPQYLHELGYTVVAFGKVAHYKQGAQYGFDLVAHDTFHDHKCIPAALEYLAESSGDGPLCLCVGTNWPHVPWPRKNDASPAELRLPPTHVDTPETRHWRARYAAAVERFDRNLGLVCDAAQENLGRDTVIIHISDHGAQWPFGKWNLYDAGIQTPMVVAWPGVTAPGSRTEAMVSLVDVLPTIVEIAGGEPATDIDGKSFARVLAGSTDKHREFIFTTHSGDGRMNKYPIRSVRTKRWKYIRNLRPDDEHHTHIDRGKPVDGSEYWDSWVRAARQDPTAKRTVERYYKRPAEELYDLQSDPHEQHNLVDHPEHSDQLQRLRQELDSWMRQQGDRGAATETAVRRAFLQGAFKPNSLTPSGVTPR